MARESSKHRSARIALLALASSVLAPRAAAAQDLASVVARARAQVETGAYAKALKTLSRLSSKNVPSALAIEAALLETTAALVTSGADAGKDACAKAIVASDYDPDVARDQSPKVRAVCREAAKSERTKRLERAKLALADLKVESPTVAWQPVRITAQARDVPASAGGASASVAALPSWLRVVARVTSSALEGSFDLALVPSLEGPLRGTLDPSWIRPRATLRVTLIAQDRFGDLSPTGESAAVVIPAAEAVVVLGKVPDTATVRIDGASVKPEPGGRIGVSPGAHRIGLELEDGASASTTVEVARGGVARVALAPQRAGTTRTFAWIAAGTAVALASTGSVLLLSADSRRREIEELSAQREEGSNLPSVEYSVIQSKDKDRDTFQKLGTAFLIGGGVVGAAAATMWLWPEKNRKSPPRAAAWEAHVGVGSISVAGVF